MIDKKGRGLYNRGQQMGAVATWLRILVALLVIPIVAGGGMVQVCNCHQEVVYAGSGCACGHAHAEKGGEGKQEQPREKHRCIHVQNELRVVQAEVELPQFTAVQECSRAVPDFRWCKAEMHCEVALALARAWLWDPPDAVRAPMLI